MYHPDASHTVMFLDILSREILVQSVLKSDCDSNVKATIWYYHIELSPLITSFDYFIITQFRIEIFVRTNKALVLILTTKHKRVWYWNHKGRLNKESEYLSIHFFSMIECLTYSTHKPYSQVSTLVSEFWN